MAALDDIPTKLQLSNQLMGRLVEVITALFPRHTGTLTLNATPSTQTVDTSCLASSVVLLQPITATAGSLNVYWIASAGSFTIYTSSGAAAAGTERYNYAIFNPL